MKEVDCRRRIARRPRIGWSWVRTARADWCVGLRCRCRPQTASTLQKVEFIPIFCPQTTQLLIGSSRGRLYVARECGCCMLRSGWLGALQPIQAWRHGVTRCNVTAQHRATISLFTSRLYFLTALISLSVLFRFPLFAAPNGMLLDRFLSSKATLTAQYGIL